MRKFDIFYADDDEDDLAFFQEAVASLTGAKKQPIALHLHPNGENLIENLKGCNAANSVVFLDINMPFKSGFQLLEEIRNEPLFSALPIIMFSTSSNQDTIAQSRFLGANSYVVKPNGFHDMLKMITEMLQTNWQDHPSTLPHFLYKY